MRSFFTAFSLPSAPAKILNSTFMRRSVIVSILLSVYFVPAFAQQYVTHPQPGSQSSRSAQPAGQPSRPKLVVGIVVDQMRWDYLYRFSDRYGSGGVF
jgi:hypothetical protein